MSINASDYGMLSTASAADNLSALKAAIAATPVGDILIIPAGNYTVDVTGGLSNAAVIDKHMMLQIEGRIKANAFAVQSNPCYMLHVAANDVVFSGHGVLAGDGTVNSDNTGDISTHPGLIYVTGDNFVFGERLTIDTPPKVGIALVGCWRARIAGTWIGGIATSASGTAYFGIIATAGGQHIFEDIDAMMRDDIALVQGSISGNTLTVGTSVSGSLAVGNMIAGRNIRPGTTITAQLTSNTYSVDKPQIAALGEIRSGRLFTNFIFTTNVSGPSNNCTVQNCRVDAWEKMFYGYGDGHFIHGNEGLGCKTDYIRVIGNRNRIVNNRISGSAGGVNVYDGSDNEICENSIELCKKVGILVTNFPGGTYSGNYNNTKITGNTLSGDSTSSQLTDGIRVDLAEADTTGIIISGNSVQNFATSAGEALIRVRVASPYSLSNIRIRDNAVGSTAKAGILLDRCIDCVIDGNAGLSISGYFLTDSGGSRNRWLYNSGKSIGTPGINGLAATSEDTGNRYVNALS